MIWTRDNIRAAIETLGQHRTVADSLAQMARDGLETTPGALRAAFLRHVGQPPKSFLKALPGDPEATEEDIQSFTRRVAAATKVKPLSQEELDRKLGGVHNLGGKLREAQSRGASVQKSGHLIHARPPSVEPGDVAPVYSPNVTGWVKVAVATDIHFGSKHCDVGLLCSFLEFAKREGCEYVVCTGDILDGHDNKLLFDQRAVGLENQVAEAVSVIASVPGLTWLAIDGNHDGYFSKQIGFTSGDHLEAKMQQAGVNWTYLGKCLGHTYLYGALWQLWHPHGAASTHNAVRRSLNKRVEALHNEQRGNRSPQHDIPPPDILAVGHYHKYASFQAHPEGAHCVAGGCFQTKGSEFSNRISNGWDVGGTIVSYYATGATTEHVSAEFYPQRRLP